MPYKRKKRVAKIRIEENLKCQGTKELQFIKEVKKSGKQLPTKAEVQTTPFGNYTPDFEYPKYFVEIKGIHTFCVMLGLFGYRGKGKASDLQWRKIKWVAQNIKPVKIYLYLGNREVVPVLDIKAPNVEIIIKGGKLLVL